MKWLFATLGLHGETWLLLDDDFDPENEQTETIITTERKVVNIAVFFLVMFQTLFHLSDAAINVLFLFLTIYFKVLAKVFCLPVFERIQQLLPADIGKACKCIGSTRDNFQKYACCPTCHSIYNISDCIVDIGGDKESRKCSYVKYPMHPHARKRKECETMLMKTVKTPSGKLSQQEYNCIFTRNAFSSRFFLDVS